MARLSTPATHGLPMPRATTAACEVMPPWAVTMPFAWIRPWMSAAAVSQRTRITLSPALPRRSAVSASSTTAPHAAPGEAFNPVAATSERRARIEHRMQQLVELRGVDPADRLVAVDQAFVDHRDRGLHRRRGRALAGARLKDVEPSVLDRELDVLHVAVVALQAVERRDELLECLRHQLAEALDRLRRANPGDDVLALRVEEELAVEPGLAGRRVAREADARGARVALVPEHHLHDVHGRAEVLRDVVLAPVDLRARCVPGGEDRVDGPDQLLARRLRERMAGVLDVDRVVGRDQLVEIGGGEVDVGFDAAARLQRGQLVLEVLAVDPVDDVAVHLDQPPVGVVGEARVAGPRGEAAHGLVVEPEVEDRVHHPRHRDRRPRANGEQQRVERIAEALAGLALEPFEVLGDLALETVRLLAPRRHEGAAGVGGDREPARHRHAEGCHLCEPGALAAEQRAPLLARFVQVVDELRRGSGCG